MKKLLFVLLSCIFAMPAFSSTYYYMKNQVSPNIAYPPTGTPVSTIISSTTNNVLSSWQTLPFPINLFGKTCTGYKASDNGYITFDSLATTSYSSGDSVGKSGIQDMALFAFFSDFELSYSNGSYNASVTNFTYGTSPNRTHVISWNFATPKGASSSSNFVFFAIVLQENGGKHIAYQYKVLNTSVSCKGSSGLRKDAGDYTSCLNSTDFPNVINNSATDDIVYTFLQGSQSSYDLGLSQTNLPRGADSGSTLTIPLNVVSNGKYTVNRFNYYYSLNGAASVKVPITALAGSNGDITIQNLDIKVINIKPGVKIQVKIWTADPNSTADMNSANDTFQSDMLCLIGIGATKKTLIEVFNGAWCGFGPDADDVLTNILGSNGKSIIPVNLHYNDSLTNVTANIAITTLIPQGYPSGCVDRLYAQGSSLTMNRNLWLASATAALNVKSPLEILLLTSFDSISRKLTIKVKGRFVDYASGDMRLNGYLVEDSLRGPVYSSGAKPYGKYAYTQHNYYSSAGPAAGGTAHPFYNEPEDLEGYVHRYAVNNIFTPTWGSKGIIPSYASPGDTFETTYTTILPNEKQYNVITSAPCTYCLAGKGKRNDLNRTYVVAFASYYDTFLSRRELLNVNSSARVSNIMTSVHNSNPVLTSLMSEVYPNPANTIAGFEVNLSENTPMNVTVTDLQGREIKSIQNGTYTKGSHTFYIDATTLTNGVYFVKIQAPNCTETKKFVVAH